MDAAVRPAQEDGRVAETIFALSSGAPPAGIAIIRVSGPEAWAAAAALTRSPLPAPRDAVLRRFFDSTGGDLLDQGLLLLFDRGASATGERTAEFHVHGGRAVVDAMLAALDEVPGLTRADAGAFTWQAFRNGCIDLTQVEGLGELLAAETETQRRSALGVAAGDLSALISSWRTVLVRASATVEAQLDFSDEDDVRPGSVMPVIGDVVDAMRKALAAGVRERLHDGIRIVVAGPPNAGKSTLFNHLCGREVTIVTDRPGTTRDLVEVDLILAGSLVKLVDTAGLRDDSNDVVERIGIDRAGDAIRGADLILWMDDEPPTDMPAPALWIHGRSDRPGRAASRDGQLSISAVTGAGIEELHHRLQEQVARLQPRAGALALNRRQRALLESALDELDAALEQTDLLLLAEHLRSAIYGLDRFTGKIYVDDMLVAVFNQFCIGK